MSEIKYPYIGKSKLECVVLFFSKGTGFCLESGVDEEGYKKIHVDLNKTSSHWIEDNFKNITSEYLTSTWGFVESEEHADFIVDLALNAGFMYTPWKSRPYFTIHAGLLRFESNENEARALCKRITIPMPPKSDAEKESSELGEWPMVGDEVLIIRDHREFLPADFGDEFVGVPGVIVRAKFKGKFGSNIFAVEHPNGKCCCFVERCIEKPKTPEQELREELIEYLNELGRSARYCFGGNDLVADELLGAYNITKKHP